MMDKTWVYLERCSKEYQDAARNFVNMAQTSAGNFGMDPLVRRGFARLEDEMREENGSVSRVDVWLRGYSKKTGKPISEALADATQKVSEYNKKHASEAAQSLKDDALTHVFGAERPGRVRALGFGATSTRFTLQAHNRSNVACLEGKIKDLQLQFDELKALFIKQGSRQKDQTTTEDTLEQSEDILQDQTATPKDSMQHSKETSQHMNPTISDASNVENGRCKLLSWMGTGEVVAEGTVASKDPLSKVHHVCLGPDCWKVWVTLIVLEDAPLYRPTSEFNVVDDAIGSTIAWPKNYIVLN